MPTLGCERTDWIEQSILLKWIGSSLLSQGERDCHQEKHDEETITDSLKKRIDSFVVDLSRMGSQLERGKMSDPVSIDKMKI
jgi:hypothetical protein